MTSPSLRRSNIPLGIAAITVSSILFAPLAQTATKFLAGDFPLFQILFFRSVGQMLWILLFFWPQQRSALFRTNHLTLQLARSSLLFGSMMCWVSAIDRVPLTTASAINFTAPIMVVMLSIPMLGERVGLHRWSAVLVGFLGALVVIQPGGGISTDMSLILAAAFLFAVYQILTRIVTATDSAATTSVYTVVVSLVVSTLVVPWHFEPLGDQPPITWAAFVATGLLGGIRHFFVVKAYEYAPASVISPFFYSELIGVALLGFLVFADVPTGATWTGAAIIIASGLYIAHRERIRSR